MAVHPTKFESPCEKTDLACEWQKEEFYSEEGELESWDLFCVDCGRWRDWKKEEHDPSKVSKPLPSTDL
jgi:hypothetical protein